MGFLARARRALLPVALAFVCLPAAGGEAADDAAAFYRDKVIRFVVGYGPGGGYDSYARLLAPHLEAETGATVVVENRPGGGGLLALNQLVSGEPDGLTIMIVNGPAAALGELLDKEGVRYELDRVQWLGRVASQPHVLLWSAQSPFRTLSDAREARRAIKWAAGGKTDLLAVPAAFLSEALGLDARIIIGYKGSKESALAAIRGEADGFFSSADSARAYAKGDKLIPAVVLARARSPLFPDVPTVFEATTLSEDEAWWIDYLRQIEEIGRALATAPGVPADRAAFLRDAFRNILTDPGIRAEAERRKRPFNYGTPEELDDFVSATLTPPEHVGLQRIRSVILKKYY